MRAFFQIASHVTLSENIYVAHRDRFEKRVLTIIKPERWRSWKPERRRSWAGDAVALNLHIFGVEVRGTQRDSYRCTRSPR
jgi:hypothetical protein